MDSIGDVVKDGSRACLFLFLILVIIFVDLIH